MQIIKCDRCNKEMQPPFVVLVPNMKSIKHYELCKECADKQVQWNQEFINYKKNIEEQVNILFNCKEEDLNKKYFG